MQLGTFGAVMVTGLLACAVTTVGIYIISRYERYGLEHSAYFMSFAAGVLISVSFLHIIPTSLHMNDRGPIFILTGFLAIYLINRFLTTYVCQKGEGAHYTAGVIPVLAIGFHSFVDGVIYSVTFNVSIQTGILAAVGMVLHEFPEGIVTFVLLNRSGFNRKRSAIYAFLAAAVSTPLGTALSFPFINTVTRPVLGLLLALSAGTLVYVGASHLLPEVEKENRRYSLVALAAGVLVAAAIELTKA